VVSKQQTPSTCHQQCVQYSTCISFCTERREFRHDSGRMDKFSLFVILDKLGASNSSGWPIPVAARSKVRVCGRSLAGIADSNTAVGMDVCLLRMLCVVR
jgi:hypothetical protein